jgi:hypothetical protein
MAVKKLVGINNLDYAINRVFDRGKPLWIVCSDETEQELAYQTAAEKLKQFPILGFGTSRIIAVKSSTGVINKRRYTIFPALYIALVSELKLQS